ncbi:peptide deformylase [Puniceicoccales bacterium CK1056]|uniref:Peptide deformylase n=1 Tax=Oceanipulchritudo coccoides TaxID=2706888 RepID=A0A6B2M0M3_9BACT|nr:peptide deformylase [Oceanipulchritudo coccoides]NDV62458.1 peptide deformylase [Oceanipulchritudo coccoides]
MQLRVTQYGEPVLRQAGKKVEVFDEELRNLVSDMIETMYAEEGVGLAAQQVNKALMVFVMDVSHLPGEELDYQLDGLRQPIDLIMPMALVNPEVEVLPGKKVFGEEGCLSFPNIRGDVPRAEAVKVDFQDINGKPHTLVCSGWVARVVQHELDHLHGRLFIDLMDKRQLRTLDSKIKRLKQNSRKALME